MIILAIETSCDDTGIAIIKALGRKRVRFKILSNIISSQIKIHRKYGGVYPALAKREHQRNLTPVLKKTLKESNFLKSKSKKQKAKMLTVNRQQIKIKKLKKILEREPELFKNLTKFFKNYKKPKIDLIAVTVGPGLEPCLWVGVNFARALAFFWKLPIIPVNHIEAHILANWLPPVSSNLKSQISNLKNIFPAICLVVSGGHTQLILMKDFGEYEILGETRDDAAGECFDKVARILGMDYPGGPAIERLAAQLKSKVKNQKSKITLPRPMIHQKNFDFSFSGLKTAVLYKIKRQRVKSKKQKFIQEMSTEVQQAIVDVLIHKTIQAARKYKARMIILGGGVTANNELRKQLQLAINSQQLTIKFLVPPKILCTDNAVMVAATAYFHYLRKETKTWRDVKADANLRIS